jgi:pimeloyl-ACP methyl ester carboxylesterase
MAPVPAKKTVQKTKVSAAGGKPLFVLAHGAGHAAKGCKHKDLQAWAKALRRFGDVVDTLKYSKPYNLMGNLCAAHSAVVEKALGTKARKVILVGFGMGARVAVHMMGRTPGDDGKALPDIPPAVLKAVKGMIAVNYPLLRVGTREVRARPLLALQKSAPRTLFVAGPKDPHMSVPALEAIRKKMGAQTKLLALPLGESEKPAELAEVVQQIARFVQ